MQEESINLRYYYPYFTPSTDTGQCQ